jgi:hypothetical protein
VKAEAFDYPFLRFDAGRFGRRARSAEEAHPNAEIASRAKAAFMLTERSYAARQTPRPSQAPRLVFHPKGATPPPGSPPRRALLAIVCQGISRVTRGCST